MARADGSGKRFAPLGSTPVAATGYTWVPGTAELVAARSKWVVGSPGHTAPSGTASVQRSVCGRTTAAAHHHAGLSFVALLPRSDVLYAVTGNLRAVWTRKTIRRYSLATGRYSVVAGNAANVALDPAADPATGRVAQRSTLPRGRPKR